MTNNVRWKQRFQNFQKSYEVLTRTLKIKDLSEAERGGLIQFFEITFELSWKLLKDYLEEMGYSPKSPRETLKQAYQVEIIKDGRTWLEVLENRNLTTHIYDEEVIIKITEKIRSSYYPIVKDLFDFFYQKIQ